MDPNSSLKINLFSRSYQVRKLVEEFQKIALMPEKNRQVWLDENGDFVNQLLDNFADDSMMILDGLQLDEEGMNLSMEYISELRDAMNTIREVIFEEARLRS